MATGVEKLGEDLKILEEMTSGMRDYLASSSIYEQRIDHELMYVTMGGYYMRRHRLVALKNLLDDSQRRRLDKALEEFDKIRNIHEAEIDQKAVQEFQSRVQQWERALRELFEDEPPSMAFYRTDVETRVMIASLLMVLQADSVSIRPELMSKLHRLDDQLKQRWQSGSFIWPDEWQPAYPQDSYWWLYGSIN